MRILIFAALGGLWCAAALGQQAGGARAAPQQQDKAATTVNQGQQANQSHAARANDPNYRFYNGRWWYWQNGGYLMWNGSRWLTPSEWRSSSYVPRRSYSYYAPSYGRSYGRSPSGGYYPYYQYGRGNPRDPTPESVDNEYILHSFGFHYAGAKPLGKY